MGQSGIGKSELSKMNINESDVCNISFADGFLNFTMLN